MTTYNVLNAGSGEVLNLDGPLSREAAESLARDIERDSDVETRIVEA
jgi:hypothetical protein